MPVCQVTNLVDKLHFGLRKIYQMEEEFKDGSFILITDNP